MRDTYSSETGSELARVSAAGMTQTGSELARVSAAGMTQTGSELASTSQGRPATWWRQPRLTHNAVTCAVNHGLTIIGHPIPTGVSVSGIAAGQRGIHHESLVMCVRTYTTYSTRMS